MLVKTKGLVLGHIKYRETSIITKIYTEVLGLKSYIVNGVRSHKKGGGKAAIFQPLTLLNLVVYDKPHTDLNRISEVQLHAPYQQIPVRHAKTVMAIFLTEVLTKALKEESGDVEVFAFLENSLLALDKMDSGYQCFHLQLMLKLCHFLGIGATQAQDLSLNSQLFHEDDTQLVEGFNDLIIQEYGQHRAIPKNTRNQMLDVIVRFYQYHLENFGEIKSLAILRALNE